eukprot:15485875-Alexandrium_andersonii.AAC.1
MRTCAHARAHVRASFCEARVGSYSGRDKKVANASAQNPQLRRGEERGGGGQRAPGRQGPLESKGKRKPPRASAKPARRARGPPRGASPQAEPT